MFGSGASRRRSGEDQDASGAATEKVPARPFVRFGMPDGSALGSGLAGAVVVPTGRRSTTA
jgi:hypothetical protein